MLLAISIAMPACAGCRKSESRADPQARIDAMYQEYCQEFPELPDVSVSDLPGMLKDRDAVLLDVREPAEQDVSMIPGSVTLSEFHRDPSKYHDRPVVTYCTIGYRSGLQAVKLKEKGWDAYNLRGGILQWVRSGQNVINKQGPTRRVHVYGQKWNILPDGYEPVW